MQQFSAVTESKIRIYKVFSERSRSLYVVVRPSVCRL